MEAVVGAIIGTVVQFVSDQANSLLKEKFNQGGDFDQDLGDLNSHFIRINGTLHDARMQQITSMAVALWLKKLEDAAFEADNALDEFNYHLLRKKAETSRKRKKSTIFSILGQKIKDINKMMDSINREAADCGIHQMLIGGVRAPGVGSDASAISQTLETDSFTVDPIFIGRDDEVSKIVEMLTTPTEEAVSILPIVGMGGLGKTTLARNVFNHRKIKTHFGQRVWVHVLQSFDAVTLLKKILTNLKVKFSGYDSKQVLLESLQEALGSATFLLVLDDVWNEDRRKWEEFSKSWSGITCTKGNGIIVTTRSTKVSSLVKTLDTHFLSGLSKEQCWSIIKDRAFAGGDILPEVEAIGRSIAGRCKGLPLAANVFGGMVCDKSQDEWRSIEKQWLSSVGGDENHILEILKLSFHHLPSPSLKKCFAYCSIFPKGSRIDSKQLIELWMAEGFLQTSDMENVGDQFLKVLLHNSLLQVVDRDEYGNVKHCSMHDLVHDVAVLVSGFPRVNGNVPFDIHSNQYICWTHEPRCIPKEQAKWLRTLFYEGEISDIIFSHFESLHALTLKVDCAKNVSDSIRKLIHLRYFHISGAVIECLPHSIGELYHLQTLRAEPKKLPSTLTCLVNLRHLHVPFHTELPPHLGRLTSLQTLPYFHVRDEDGHRIVELGSLKYLKGELMIDNLEKVQGEEDSKKAYLSQKSGIVRLALSWSVKGKRREGDDKNVLDGLQPHTSLMILEIAGFNGASFPLWTSKMAIFLEGQWVGLNSLMEIKLSDCLECEDIPSMGHLPRLKSLYLYSLKNIKSIGSSFYCKETISVFPALERLELWDLENLREWEEVGIPGDAQVKAFPRLEYLKIRECKQLTSAPSQFTCLKILIIDEMKSGSPLANICSNKLKTLTELKIGNVDGLTCLPDWLFHNNQRLSVLEIIDCSNLIELPDGMHSLNSLNELNLRRCDSLKSIPYSSSGGLTFLRRLSIWECPKLMNFPVGMVESCAPLLEKLSIDVGDSDSWRRVSFKKSIDGVLRLGSQSLRRLELRGEDWESLPNQLQRLTSLSELWLSGFGIEVLPEWLGDFSSLSKLKVSYCKKLKHLPSAEAMRRLTNLSCLIIYRCPLLEERCIEQQSSDDVDSQWPKICHLLNIRIGGRPIRSGGWQSSMECEYPQYESNFMSPIMSSINDFPDQVGFWETDTNATHFFEF